VVTSVYLVVALALTVALNVRQGITPRITVTLFALAVPAGSIGSRLLDVLEYWGRYQSVGDVVGRHGSSIYGGLLAGFAVAWAYAATQGVPPLRLLDAGGPVVALGEAMTRIGCFLNGCCYGVPWSGRLAVTFPQESFAFRDQVARGLLASSAPRSLPVHPVHPVQLYSTVVMLGVSLYLLRRFTRRRYDGEVFFAFLVAYGVLRLLVAPLRMEALASMKVFNLVFIVCGGLGLTLARPATSRSAS